MNFCGYCGSLLVPNSPICPSCGAVNDAVPPANNYGGNNATHFSNASPVPGASIANDSPTAFYPVEFQPSPQPPVVVRSSPGNSHPGDPAAEDAISHANAAWSLDPQNQTMPSTPLPNSSSSSINPSVPSNPFLTNNQSISYPGYQPQQPPLTPYPVQSPGTYTPQPSPQRRRGLIALLVVVACMLILTTGGLAFLATHPNLLNGLGSQQQNPQLKATMTAHVNNSATAPVVATVAPTATPTPSQLAQIALHRYFDDINQKNYPGAYSLWINPPQTYDNFAAGFSNTLHDDTTFNNVALQSDGTVKIAVTIVAEENNSGSIQYSTYTGYYIMMQQSGGWEIYTAHIDKA